MAPGAVRQDCARTDATRRAVYLCLARDGMHLRGAAKRLKLHHATVQRHARFLLAAGVIEPLGALPKPRTVSFYQKGQKAAEFEAGAPGAGGPGVAPREPFVVEPHRGTVRIDALRCPKDPAGLPGLTRSAAPNGARVFWYRFPGEGGLYSAQLNVRRDGTGTLQVTAPARRTADLGVALDVEARLAACQKAAIAWGQPFGLELVRDRAAPRMVQPLEWAMPMPGLKLEPTGRPGVDKAWADGSHPDSIETQSAEVVRFVGDGPDLRREWQRVAARVDELLQAGLTAAQVVDRLTSADVQHSRVLAFLLSHQAGAAAGAALPPLPPLAPRDSGVDVT